MKNKFEIGDQVKEKGQPNSEGGKVVKIQYDSDLGFSYVFESKEVDHKRKEVINGVKTCNEKELEAFDAE